MKGSPVLIRYADDFVVHCHTRQQALEVKARSAAWLAPRGLAFNEDKTQVVSLTDGYDFLGFNVRRYGRKLLIKPSKTAVRRIRRRLRDECAPCAEQRSGGDQAPEPDHPGIGRLLPDTGIRRGLRHAGLLPVAAHMEVGHTQPREQVDELGVRPVLRQVQQGQARPVGVRRPHQRRAHAPLRLDQHRPTPHRQAPGITRRPRACRLLGLATTESAPADQPHRPMAPPPTGRPLRDLQDHATRRLRPPTNPTRMGALAGHHSQDDRRRLEHSQLGRRATLSYPAPLQHHPPATRACLSRMLGNGHVRF